MTAGLEIRSAVLVHVRHSQDDLHNKSGRGFAAAANEKGHHLRVIRKSRGLRFVSTGARRRWTLEEKRRIVAESNNGR